MKSRTIVWLAIGIVSPVATVSAQVMPIGKAPRHGGVQRASCESCGERSISFYGSTVWGTDCFACNTKPGLFPPCPNPCKTTLLGELIVDVKVGVEGALSHVFGCLFVHPCGCYGECVCAPACDRCEGDCFGGGTDASSMSMPMVPTPANGDTESNPFRDDPVPSPMVQPQPRPSVTHSIVPRSRPSRPNVARRISYERPAESPTSRSSNSGTSPLHEQPSSMIPVPPVTHYHPRRSATLRRSNGEAIERTVPRQKRSTPPLRFRDAESPPS